MFNKPIHNYLKFSSLKCLLYGRYCYIIYIIIKLYSNYFIYRNKLKLVLVLFNFSEVFKVAAGPTDGPIVINAADSEYLSSTVAIPSSRGLVKGIRRL